MIAPETIHLSRDFTLDELCRTATGLLNFPTSDAQLASLVLLCTRLLQPIRDEWGPVYVSSGYRSAAVNTAIGGSRTSQHLRGEAADIVIERAPAQDVVRWIAHRPALRWGQLIWEHPPSRVPWVHVSLPTLGERNGQVLHNEGRGVETWAV